MNCFFLLQWNFCFSEGKNTIYLFGSKRVNPFPNNKILDCSKLKEFADDKFKFDKNDRNFSKW